MDLKVIFLQTLDHKTSLTWTDILDVLLFELYGTNLSMDITLEIQIAQIARLTLLSTRKLGPFQADLH